MNLKKLSLLALAGAVCGLVTVSAIAEDEPVDYQPFSVSLEGGTLGIGGSVGWRFADHFGVRGGASYLGWSRDNDEIEGITYDTDLTLLNFPVSVDFYPWTGKSFRISAGVLINQNEVEGNVPNPGAPGTIVTIGNNTYDVFNDLGSMNLKVEQDPVAPFLSVGMNFHLDEAKHWSLGGEVGVAYTGSPDAALSIANGATAANPTFQADRAQEEAQIEDELARYKIYPIVKLAVTFSF